MQIFPSDKFAFDSTKTMHNEIVTYRSGSGQRKSMNNVAYPISLHSPAKNCKLFNGFSTWVRMNL